MKKFTRDRFLSALAAMNAACAAVVADPAFAGRPANLATAANPIKTSPGDEIVLPLAVAACYSGNAAGVVIGTGYATPLNIATAGMKFVGIFEGTYDNSAGTLGGASLTIRRRGLATFKQGVTFTQAMVGFMAYFSDDATITNVPGAVEAGIITDINSVTGFAEVDITSVCAAAYGGATANFLRITPQIVVTNVSGVAQAASTLTVPAGSLKAGDKLIIDACIVGVTRTSTDTAALSLAYGGLGGTAIITPATLAHATTNTSIIHQEFTIAAGGTAGFAFANGYVTNGTANAAQTITPSTMGSSAFNTTLSQAFTIGVTFSASNTTDQIGVNKFDIQIVRS